MALLIDGYNLLHVTDIFGAGGAGTALAGSRQALLDFLAAALDAKARAETTIVFDAAGAPPGLPRTIEHEGVTIRFARPSAPLTTGRFADADEMIEALIEAHPAPRSLTVVSSDHRVQRAARRRGAAFVDSDRWYADLKAARRDPLPSHEEPPAKPVGEITPEQVDYWLDRFSEPKNE